MENIILSTDEDITEFTDEEQVKVKLVNIELKQHCWFDGEKREFMIFNNKHCYQRVEYKKGGKKKFRVNLSYLNAIPQRRPRYAYNWYMATLMLIAIAGLSGYALWQDYAVNPLFAGSLAVVAGMMAIPMFFVATTRSTCRIVFTSHYGKAPVLELINGSPNHREFVTFIDVLQQKINCYNHPKNVGKRQYLVDELNELRRLKNEGVISSSVFNNAMRRVMCNPAYKKQ